MSIDLEDEIVQDFVVEAGEILELLGEQLVELEQSPENIELLNAIFRGFHTIKGGAGFLALDPLVEICHQAEDLFNILRQGDQQVTTELMDVFLWVLDVVNEMFVQIRSGEDPVTADSELLAALNAFKNLSSKTSAQSEAEINEPDVVEQEFESLLTVARADSSEVNLVQHSSDDEITEKEFDDLLNVLDEVSGSPLSKRVEEKHSEEIATSTDEITEEEFEDLLDELHGKGKFLICPTSDHASTGKTDERNAAVTADEITEEEFDALLDSLHGPRGFGLISSLEDEGANGLNKHQSQDKSSSNVASIDHLEQSRPSAKQTQASVLRMI